MGCGGRYALGEGLGIAAVPEVRRGGPVDDGDAKDGDVDVGCRPWVAARIYSRPPATRQPEDGG